MSALPRNTNTALFDGTCVLATNPIVPVAPSMALWTIGSGTSREGQRGREAPVT